MIRLVIGVDWVFIKKKIIYEPWIEKHIIIVKVLFPLKNNSNKYTETFHLFFKGNRI